MIVSERRQLEAIAEDVSKRPAKGNCRFEIQARKRSFRHVAKMDGAPICSEEGRSRQTPEVFAAPRLILALKSKVT